MGNETIETTAKVVEPETGTRIKLVTLLLAIFLGNFGIHNFYLGYTKKAIIQLAVSVLLSWTLVAPIAIWVWAIIEGVQAYRGTLADSDGKLLAD